MTRKRIPRKKVFSTTSLPAHSSGSIKIYQTRDGRVSLNVRLDQENLWLTQKDLAALFETERSVVTKHIRNILKTKELESNSVCAKFAHTAADGKTYFTQFYNLDMIIGVGYRVNSRRGTEFRIWATQVLKDHILRGYTVNEQRLRDENTRLRELQATVDMMGRILNERPVSGTEAEGLLHVITDYSLALRILDQYDHQQLQLRTTTETSRFVLTYGAAKAGISRMMETLGPDAGAFFGREKDDSLKSSIGAIYQTFDGQNLYPSVEEKAAHLLYFVVKNHPFVDGNKRVGAFLFIWFLDANGLLYRKDGTKRLADNALVALTLLIAESKPAEKETIIKVVVNLINRENP
jgi:prophage maintenance system killer protein